MKWYVRHKDELGDKWSENAVLHSNVDGSDVPERVAGGYEEVDECLYPGVAVETRKLRS